MIPKAYSLHWKTATRYARKALTLASTVTEKIPSQSDSPLQKAVKVMAITNELVTLVLPETSAAYETHRFLRGRGLIGSTENRFLGGILAEYGEEMEVGKIKMYQVLDEDLGELIMSFSKECIYHKPGLDFTPVFDRMWAKHNGRLYINKENGVFHMSSFSAIDNPLYGEDGLKLSEILRSHRQYQVDNVARSYMFYGPPGTGKTSQALRFADALGGRICRMDGTAFASLGYGQITDCLEMIAPDVVLVDDVDKIGNSSNLNHLLNLMEEIKQRKCTSMVFTCNKVKDFDKGFLRPNRIDTWVKFDLPCCDTRRLILREYLKASETNVNDETLDKLSEETEGLSQDYLREVALRMKYESTPQVLTAITHMKELLAA